MKALALASMCAVLCLPGCGDETSPTRQSSVSAPARTAVDEATNLVTASGPRAQVTEGPTVAEILTSPDTFLGQQVQLMGQVTQPLTPTSFLFNDGTATIPVDFPAGPLPTLNDTILIEGTVTAGTGDFAARISVQTWEMPVSFSCDDIVEIRARFSDPGFVAGNVVGYYLAYLGVPPGDKTLEIVWDEGNPSGKVDRFELGEGKAREDGLFDLSGVVGHEYPDIRGPETKKVRANLMIVGRAGRCSRVRDVAVDRGSGPAFAAGGALSLRFNDPVPSGGFFSVTARVSNPTTQTIDARLFFSAPDGSTIRTLGAGCTQLNDKEAECLIQGIAGKGFGEEFVQYDVPTVNKPTLISGAVTLVARDFSPVANYSTTVEP